jgi:translation initiation factor 6
MDFMGSPNIGIYSLTTDRYAIVPTGLQYSKIKKIENCLKVITVQTDICRSKLIGVFAAANSNGIVLPKYAENDEVERMKRLTGVNVERIDSEMTALGNLILANDNGAVVSPLFMRMHSTLASIENILGVEISIGEIAGSPYVGSLGVATDKGVLTHPEVKEDERKKIMEILKVPVYNGTINMGVPIVSSGLVANASGALVGFITSGSEVFTISNAFEV